MSDKKYQIICKKCKTILINHTCPKCGDIYYYSRAAVQLRSNKIIIG